MFTLQMITDGGPDARNAAQPALGQGQLGGQAVKPDEQAVHLRYCQFAGQRRGSDAVGKQATWSSARCRSYSRRSTKPNALRCTAPSVSASGTGASTAAKK
ncbi:MAG: hypothetical protein ACYCXN_05215 [Acidimicrobiales bacterium]|jgi:hypothetical protein